MTVGSTGENCGGRSAEAARKETGGDDLWTAKNEREAAAPGPAIREVYARFFDGAPASAEVIDTGRGDGDFRHTVILTTEEGEKRVLKIAANEFTSPGRVRMWQRTAEEYRAAYDFVAAKAAEAGVSIG